MDNAQVTACDESAALSQSAYVLFSSREGEWEGGAGGGSAAPLMADPHTPGNLTTLAPGCLREMPVAEHLGRRCPQGTQRSKESA